MMFLFPLTLLLLFRGSQAGAEQDSSTYWGWLEYTVQGRPHYKLAPSQAHYDATGRLTYSTDSEGNRVPDFSYAGYRYGQAALPEWIDSLNDSSDS